jgi:hypothetical protein
MVSKDSIHLQSTLSDDEIVERFTLVLLHSATGGDIRGFLSPVVNTCSWNSDVVACNDESSVVSLNLGKFVNFRRLLSCSSNPFPSQDHYLPT